MKKLLPLLIVVISNFAIAQTTDNLLPPIITPAPNAASLLKFGDIPISYYTGTANISVPLYTVNGSVPVMLQYHASGIKVEDIASWVGLGWTFSGGGTLTRVVRGLPDESPEGFLNQGHQIENSNLTASYLYAVSRGLIDTESDVYFFSTPSGSGKFFLTYTGDIILQDYKDVKIESPFATGQPYWKIISEDGTQYFFGKDGEWGGVDGTEYIEEGSVPFSYISSWHMQKMISSDKRESIYFEYANQETIEYEIPGDEGRYMSRLDPGEHPFYINCHKPTITNKSINASQSVNQALLSKIVFENGSVELIPSQEYREDLQGGHWLAQLNVKNNLNELLKYYTFSYEYFGSFQDKRLKLINVTEYGLNGAALPPYLFTYNESVELPSRFSTKKDHWGYYNANPSESLIPKIIEKRDGTFLYNADGADRDTDGSNVLAGILTKIKYPTGGETTFDYDPHDVSRVGFREVEEYYSDPHILRCHFTNDCPDPESFTLDSQATAKITMSCNCFGPVERAPAYASLQYLDPINPRVWAWGCSGSNAGGTQTWYETLPPGNYVMTANAEWINADVRSSSVVDIEIYRKRIVSAETPVLIGGVRVRKITNYTNDNIISNVLQFDYKRQLEDGTYKSSGVLVRNPIYHFEYAFDSGPIDPAGTTLDCTGDAALSNAKISHGDGEHIGYSEVRVTQGENGENGYTIYKFIAADEEPVMGGKVYPFAPVTSREQRRGLLKERLEYDKDANLKHQVINEYLFNNPDHRVSSANLKVGKYYPDTEQLARTFKYQYYNNRQEWQYLKTTIEKSFHGTEAVSTQTDYLYERPQNHVQLTRTEQTGSNGKIHSKRLKYPSDYHYGNDPLLNSNQALINSNALSKVIEEQNWIYDGSWSMVSGNVLQYNPLNNSPQKVWSFENDLPAGTLNNETLVNDRFDQLLSDNQKYKLRLEAAYDESHNLIQRNPVKDIVTAYIWGYNGSRVVAQASNAKRSDIYYTGFEEGPEGNSADFDSKVGKRSTTNNFFRALDSLTPGNYQLSYWKKENDEWLYYPSIVEVSGSTYAISIEGQLDEIRFHPASAQMTTYTYDPIRGVTSVTDTNNLTTYYKYDDFGRLELIKDSDENIVKHHKYHYKGQ